MKSAGFKFGLAFVFQICLLSCAWEADFVWNLNVTCSLSYASHVSASGPRSCVVQGTVNKTTFLKYNSSNLSMTPVGPLGMMLSATEVWSQLVEHFKDLVEELLKALLDNKQNIYEVFHSFPLQVSMMTQQESSGLFSSFWKFGFKGRMCLRFNSKNRHWSMLNKKCRLLRKILVPDRDITNLLVSISHGDSKKLFNEIVALDTKAAPATASAPASSKATTVTHNTSPGSSVKFVS